MRYRVHFIGGAKLHWISRPECVAELMELYQEKAAATDTKIVDKKRL